MPKHYLITVEGVEPTLHGPFSGRERDEKAREINATLHPEDDLIFWMEIDKKGTPQIGAFSGAFFDEE